MQVRPDHISHEAGADPEFVAADVAHVAQQTHTLGAAADDGCNALDDCSLPWENCWLQPSRSPYLASNRFWNHIRIFSHTTSLSAASS